MCVCTVEGPVLGNVQSLQHYMHDAVSCLEHIDAMQIFLVDTLGSMHARCFKGQQLCTRQSAAHGLQQHASQ